MRKVLKVTYGDSLKTYTLYLNPSIKLLIQSLENVKSAYYIPSNIAALEILCPFTQGAHGTMGKDRKSVV